MLDARAGRRLDDGEVLSRALADLAPRDEQYAVDAGERSLDGRGVVVVERHDSDAALREVSGLRGRARTGDDLRRGDAASEQCIDDEVAEGAGGAGDENGHGVPFGRGSRSAAVFDGRTFPNAGTDFPVRYSPNG